MARKLAIHLLWMMRRRWDYEQVKRFGPHAGQPETRRGVDEGDFEHLWPALLTLRASRKHTSHIGAYVKFSSRGGEPRARTCPL